MIDDVAKSYLHTELRAVREAILGKLDGLGEYDVRRPLILTEANRHAGHADILREQLDGSIGTAAGYAGRQHDAAFWAARRTEIERVARAADPTIS